MNKTKKILEIFKLSKTFGGLHAIEQLDISINVGEILGIIGPNGSGKTTLLNMITGFISPTSGKIFYKDKEIHGLKPFEIAKMGLVRTFQITSIFSSLTILENVINGHYLKTKSHVSGLLFNTRGYRYEERKLKKKAEEILDFIGLKENHNRVAKEISVADQRKLEIAIALASEPELLLLDEPGAGMNTEEQSKLLELFNLINNNLGITIVIVEHNMKIICESCSRVVVLSEGKKIAQGTPKEVTNDQNVILVYLGGRKVDA